ncbi:DUF3769 domain-containing protein [Vulcanococcus sp.]|uniref:DUF3769 domain-containing protein n=1 Tax=Vulcanococcus sp. TaxID=2856995 RepID=UPI003BFD1103
MKEPPEQTRTDQKSQNTVSKGDPQALVAINLRADQQGFDQQLQRYVAKGNVSVDLAGGRVLADRLEYETASRTLLLSGRVRFQRGEQYFQANSLRYSLIENSGDADAVYGVIDFDTSEVDFDLQASPSLSLSPLSYWPTTTPFAAPSWSSAPPQLIRPGAKGERLVSKDWSNSTAVVQQALSANPLSGGRPAGLKGLALNGIPSAQELSGLPEEPNSNRWRVPPIAVSPAASTMACTPLIPPVPNWHPYPLAITAWGYGQAIDANFGDSFVFNGRWRPESLWGVNFNKRLIDAGPLALEFDSNALLHKTSWQPGGEFNNSQPFAPLPPQTFGEFTVGFGLRAWLQPWLSLGFVEGVSLLTSNSLYEQTFRGEYQTFLNYLGFEVEALVKPQWSLVGRLHHRSGAYGTYGGVSEGSNAYLVGLRYRFGEAPPPQISPEMPPAAGCPGAPAPGEGKAKPLADQLNAVASTQPAEALAPSQPPPPPELSKTPAAQLEKERHAAIAATVDQRVSDLYYVRSLKFERRQGSPFTSVAAEEQQFQSVKPTQLINPNGDQKLIEGYISRWRFQAARITITPQGWSTDRAAFSNDPFTPAQSWVDMEQVVAVQESDTRTRISAKRSRLILENRLPIPMRKNIVLEKDQPADSPWVLADDGVDRSGVYLGYKIKDIDLIKGRSTTNSRGEAISRQPLKLKLQPQFMVARALNGEVNSYPLPGDPAGGPNGSQPAQIGDLFGGLVKLEGSLFGYTTSDFTVSLSTLNPQNIANGTRSWGDFSKQLDLPKLGFIPGGTYTTRLFGAYRYKTYNGSLGQQDVYSALGASLERKGDLKPWGSINHNYFWRAAFGNFQGNDFDTSTIIDNTRGSFFGAVNSSLQIWQGKAGNRDNPRTTQNTPQPITPGLRLNTNTSVRLDYYGDGTNQNTLTLTGGPTLTLGRLEKNFFDFTELSVTGGGSLQQGQSPFAFDRNVDLATVGVGLKQQLFGPLLISGAIGFNVDPNSGYYGDITGSYAELIWQRRGYEFAIYYSPYEQVGGIRIRLNDFNYQGTGLPFVPYTPTNATKRRQSLF